MKIAILADLHDNLKNLELILEMFKEEKPDELIFCGDMCAPATLKELAKGFPGKIHLIFGNVDGDPYLMEKRAQENDNLIIYGLKAELELDNKKIAVVHYPDFAEGLASTGKYDVVFYGHDHQKNQTQVGKTLLVNPGTAGGMFQYPTFAIYNTKNNQIEFKEISL